MLLVCAAASHDAWVERPTVQAWREEPCSHEKGGRSPAPQLPPQSSFALDSSRIYLCAAVVIGGLRPIAETASRGESSPAVVCVVSDMGAFARLSAQAEEMCVTAHAAINVISRGESGSRSRSHLYQKVEKV